MTVRVGRTAMLAAVALAGTALAVAAEPPAHPSATPVKHHSLKACTQQADAKKLTGASRSEFLRHCQTQSAPHPVPATQAAR
jgi:hypothetical protein